jgi:hypothetical protein
MKVGMGGMVEEEEEARERQLAELEFVQSAYAIEEARVTENRTNGRLSVVRSLTLPVNPALNENSHHFVMIELNLEMPPAYPVRKESTLLVTGLLIHSPANPTFRSESCAEFASAFSGRVPRSSNGVCR